MTGVKSDTRSTERIAKYPFCICMTYMSHRTILSLTHSLQLIEVCSDYVLDPRSAKNGHDEGTGAGPRKIHFEGRDDVHILAALSVAMVQVTTGMTIMILAGSLLRMPVRMDGWPRHTLHRGPHLSQGLGLGSLSLARASLSLSCARACGPVSPAAPPFGGPRGRRRHWRRRGGARPCGPGGEPRGARPRAARRRRRIAATHRR